MSDPPGAHRPAAPAPAHAATPASPPLPTPPRRLAGTSTQDKYGYTPLSYLPASAKRNFGGGGQLGGGSLGVPAIDGSSANWQVTEVVQGGPALQGSVASVTANC